jgi:hypothetical protein
MSLLKQEIGDVTGNSGFAVRTLVEKVEHFFVSARDYDVKRTEIINNCFMQLTVVFFLQPLQPLRACNITGLRRAQLILTSCTYH